VKSLLDVPENQRDRMSQAAAELFVNATMAEMMGQAGEPFDGACAAKLGAIGQIMWQRLQWADAKITVAVGIFLAWLAEGNPGNAVMWAYTMTRLYQKLGRTITTADLAGAFPMGFPTEAGRLAIWDGQKGDGPFGNLLDLRETWQPEPTEATHA